MPPVSRNVPSRRGPSIVICATMLVVVSLLIGPSRGNRVVAGTLLAEGSESRRLIMPTQSRGISWAWQP